MREIKLVPFYRFVRTVDKLIEGNFLRGKRVYFDALYRELEERLDIGFDQFRIYVLDLSMIFPGKVRLNPKHPADHPLSHENFCVVETGGTEYDSLVVKGPLLK